MRDPLAETTRRQSSLPVRISSRTQAGLLACRRALEGANDWKDDPEAHSTTLLPIPESGRGNGHSLGIVESRIQPCAQHPTYSCGYSPRLSSVECGVGNGERRRSAFFHSPSFQLQTRYTGVPFSSCPAGFSHDSLVRYWRPRSENRSLTARVNPFGERGSVSRSSCRSIGPVQEPAACVKEQLWNVYPEGRGLN